MKPTKPYHEEENSYHKKKMSLDEKIWFNQHFCLCGKPATEHHHTTDPVTVDDFIFVCHNCHVLIDVRRERWKEKN